jgi:uncharacterized protein YbaR (Trm112 family)
MIRCVCALCLLLLAVGCDRAKQPMAGPTADAPKPAEKAVPVVPPGFNEQLLDILRCPENLTVVRLATWKELESANERIKAGTLKTWAGKNVPNSVNAMLIRADNKIGYRFEGAAPVMIIEEALVLDETVGKPDPDRYRLKLTETPDLPTMKVWEPQPTHQRSRLT